MSLLHLYEVKGLVKGVLYMEAQSHIYKDA